MKYLPTIFLVLLALYEAFIGLYDVLVDGTWFPGVAGLVIAAALSFVSLLWYKAVD